MSSPFVAEIKMFAGNFAPTGYATCDGQLLPISQNTAHSYSITYDGKIPFFLHPPLFFLIAAGFLDVVRRASDKRALVISGAFRQINEGYRRRVGAENSHITGDVMVEYQTPGAAPIRVMSFPVDSRLVPPARIPGLSPKRGADIEAAAARVGAYVGSAVLNLARLNQWPAAPR